MVVLVLMLMLMLAGTGPATWKIIAFSLVSYDYYRFILCVCVYINMYTDKNFSFRSSIE